MRARAVLRELVAMIALLGCGPSASRGFAVPEHCFGAGTAIEVRGLEDGELRRLHYGPQGGQHVVPGIVLRGVDPRALTVEVVLTRELDGVTIATQVFTRFVPGIGECDVALPETELFVQSRFADGATASARITAYQGMTSEVREVSGVCVSSSDVCGPYDALIVRAGADAIADGSVVATTSGELALAVEGSGIVWGRVGSRTVEQRTSTPITFAVSAGESVPIALALSPELSPSHGVLGTFEGTITIAGP